MEFDFNIDPIFPNHITVLTPAVLQRLIKRDSDLKEKYKLVIDRLGQSSAKAQSLPSVITLFNKFLIADPACHLFVLREGEARREEEEEEEELRGEVLDISEKDAIKGLDAQAGNERNDATHDGSIGADSNSKAAEAESQKDSRNQPHKSFVLGFLKVGPKDLFLHNETEELVKVKPFCVLDFYISENCQRRGCGKTIFDFMLHYLNRDEGFDYGREGGCVGGAATYQSLKPRHFAYDRPSKKLLPFLNKHYNLSQPVPQFNKFFISTGFFHSDNPCWDNNNSVNNYGGKDAKQTNRQMTYSKSGGSFFPYSGGSGGSRQAAGVGGGREAAGVGGSQATASSRDPLRRRWLSEDSVSGGQSWQFGDKTRPNSVISGSERRDILRGLENVSIGSAENDGGRYSRHINKPNPTQPYPPPQQPLKLQPQISAQQQQQPHPLLVQQQSPQPCPVAASSAVIPTSLSLEFEAKPEFGGRNRMSESEVGNDLTTTTSRMTTSNLSTRDWKSRDWTSTPRIPIGSEISNPRSKDPHQNPLSPSASSVSNAFIWMPSSTPVDYRTRAPFATTSPKAEGRTSTSAASAASAATSIAAAASAATSSNKLGNKRFQRTSLW